MFCHKLMPCCHSDIRLPRDEKAWEPRAERQEPRRWPANDPYDTGSRGAEASRTRSPEMLRHRPNSPPPPPPPPARDARRYDDALVEHPVAGKVHPERARLLGGPVPGDLDGAPPPPAHPRARARSPDYGYPDRARPRDLPRDLPQRPLDDARLAPPRDRSPPPPQNGHRPGVRRGGSLLERLTLDDSAPPHDGGSSLRDRVDLNSHGSSEGAPSGQVESMEVDFDGGNPDDAGKGGGAVRGGGRRRNGKPKRPRRNGAP
ncbi:hypothetical protein C8Q77DRAFT_649004 [Trametes polyzona]|nr:hypothetical protein C8Q77DRAFT_649004 [Trametes polyzona]